MPTWPGDLHVDGRFSCGRFTPPNASIGNDAANPDDALDEDKTYHREVQLYVNTASTVAAADETKIFYIAWKAGSVTAVRVGIADAATGDSTVTVNVKKNGTTILSGVVTITNAEADYDVVAAGLTGGNPVAYVADDVFEAVIDATVGTGTLPKGVTVMMVTVENPS